MVTLLKASRNLFSVLETLTGFMIKYKRAIPTTRNKQVRGNISG